MGIDHVAKEMLQSLRVERRDTLEAKLAGERAQELALEQALAAARTTVQGLKQRRDGLGGQQLAALEASKVSAERDEGERSQRYGKVAEACKALGFTVPAKAEGYAELVTQGRRELPSAASGADDTAQKQNAIAVQKHELDKERSTILSELAVLARMPGSKMGADLITMRKLITDGLGYDEGALPFAGELIEVEPSEKGWTGPVERVLRNFSRTMLVPDNLHAAVAKFINSTNLRGRLVYLRMMRQSPRTPAPKPNGVYRKIKVSDGPFQDWVETELLQNYDAECVETERDLEDVVFGITRAGLLKTGVVAVIKLGNAVALVTRIAWLVRVPVLYWGDIDTYGYSILVQARKKLHDVRSVLMDRSTVETHLDRLVEEGQQMKSIDRSLLTAAELDVYDALLAHDWGTSRRLEQERLEWPSALRTVLSALHQRESKSA